MHAYKNEVKTRALIYMRPGQNDVVISSGTGLKQKLFCARDMTIVPKLSYIGQSMLGESLFCALVGFYFCAVFHVYDIFCDGFTE